MQFKQYPSYKPSGVEWLGDVPEHWHVANIKRSTYLKGRVGWKGLTSNEFEVESYAYLVTGTDFKNKYVEWSFCYQVNEERFNDDPYIQLKNNDLLITKDGTIGKLAVVKDLDKPACLNSGIFLIRPEKYYLSEYMYYILKSSVFKNFFEIHSTGSTILHLYQNVFEKFSFAYPSFNEQKKIVSFLDTETTRIDNLIAKQEKLIELLEEQRKSIISHAVTKGLNPNAPMKDSGVEWLGDVPEHWEVTRLKNIGKSIIGLTYSPNEICNPDDDSYLVLRSSNVQNGQLSFLDNVYVKSYVSEKLKIKKNDILICSRNGSRDLIGKNTIIKNPPKNSTFGAFMTVYRSEHADYVYWILNSYIFKAQAGSYLTTTVNQLTINNLNSMTVPFAPTSEQNEIVEFLSTENLKFNNLISKQKALIEKLKEYRSSIISHAVTGKIDVREFGA